MINGRLRVERVFGTMTMTMWTMTREYDERTMTRGRRKEDDYLIDDMLCEAHAAEQQRVRAH